MIPGIIASAVCAFVFAGLESGLTALHRVRLRQLAKLDKKPAVVLDRLLRRPGSLLAVILSISLLARIFLLAFLFVTLSGNLGEIVAVVVLLACLPLLAVLLDFFPKALFRSSPYRMLCPFVGLLEAIAAPLAPVERFFHRLGMWRMKRLGEGSISFVTNEGELREAINTAEKNASISPLQKHFLHSVINTRTLTLEDLSQPLSSLPTVAPQEKISELLERAEKENQNLWLVTDGSPAPLGVVFLFDLLLDGIHAGSCQSYMRRLPSLRGDESPLIALLKMRASRASLALVESQEGAGLRIVTSRLIVAHLLHGPKRAR